MNTVPAHEILPGIWLGNKYASKDRMWLKTQNIGAVFNCTKDLPFLTDGPPHMYRVPVDDDLEPSEIRNLETWAWEICYKIRKEHASGNRILIHCAAGMQRSAAVVAMYLIATYRATTDEAIAFIKSKRPVSFMGNVNFYPAIHNFEQSLRRMISANDSYRELPRIPLPTDTISNT